MHRLEDGIDEEKCVERHKADEFGEFLLRNVGKPRFIAALLEKNQRNDVEGIKENIDGEKRVDEHLFGLVQFLSGFHAAM